MGEHAGLRARESGEEGLSTESPWRYKEASPLAQEASLLRTVARLVALSVLVLCVVPASAFALPTCPDYGSVANPPALQGPVRRSFRHTGSQILSWTYPPYHMVHDQIVPVGTQATVVGKFDYSNTLHKDLEDVNSYAAKGYQIIYLTGRPYWVGKDTREWLDYQGLVDGHVHTNPYGEGPIPPNTEQYKTDYLTYLLEEVGLDIVRVYGNATTDIGAYAAAGLPKSETHIIGENAGADGTMPIRNDYLQHLLTVVASTPNANCTPR